MDDETRHVIPHVAQTPYSAYSLESLAKFPVKRHTLVAYVVGSFRDVRLLGSLATKVPRLAKVLLPIAFTIFSR